VTLMNENSIVDLSTKTNICHANIWRGNSERKKFAMPVFMTKIFNKATVKVKKKILPNDINEHNFSVTEPEKNG